MKKIIVISIVLVGLAFGFAYAHNNGGLRGGFGNGGHMMGGGYGHGAHMMGGGYGMMGPGMMRGYGSNSNNYAGCPGWSSFRGNGWNSEIHQRYLQDTVGLRKELNDKRFEYMEARRNPASSADQLAALEREISDLQLEMQKKAEQYN